jgi:TonB family protein
MIGDSNLKITAFISLAIHILIIVIVSGLSGHPKTHRTTTLRNVQVTLLPLATKEKTESKIIPPIPLKVQTQEGEEPVFDHLGLSRESLLPPKSTAKNISPEEPKPISKNEEGEKTSNVPMTIAETPGSASETDSEGNTVFSKETTSIGGDLSISLPSIQSGELSGNVFSYKSPGERGGSGSGSGSGTGSGSGGSGNRGSGKGTGIFGKFFYGHGGGNGARPRYAENPKPTYPQEAREKGYEGEVILRVEVLSNGRVGQMEVRKSSGHEALDRSALTTVKQWRFIPAMKDDIAIPLWVNIPIKFQLQ